MKQDSNEDTLFCILPLCVLGRMLTAIGVEVLFQFELEDNVMFNFVTSCFSRNVARTLLVSVLMLGVCSEVVGTVLPHPSIWRRYERETTDVENVVVFIMYAPVTVPLTAAGLAGVALYKAGEKTYELIEQVVYEIREHQRRKRETHKRRKKFIAKMEEVVEYLAENKALFEECNVTFPNYDADGVRGNLKIGFGTHAEYELMQDSSIKVQLIDINAEVVLRTEEGLTAYELKDITAVYEFVIDADCLESFHKQGYFNFDEGDFRFVEEVDARVIKELIKRAVGNGPADHVDGSTASSSAFELRRYFGR